MESKPTKFEEEYKKFIDKRLNAILNEAVRHGKYMFTFDNKHFYIEYRGERLEE